MISKTADLKNKAGIFLFMENIEINYSNSYSQKKLIIIVVAVVLFVVTSPLPLILGESSAATQLTSLLMAIALNLLVFAWCHYDCLERNQTFGAGWRLLLILLGALALLIYLPKSRGFKQGLIAIGKALLIFVVMIIGSIIATILTATFMSMIHSKMSAQ